MHTLIAELTRLYLAPGMLAPQALEQQLLGEASAPVNLVSDAGTTRALAIAFRQGGAGSAHWQALCTLANALQVELDLPAPAVSIAGADGYHLWLSLERLTPVALVQQFVALLGAAYLPDAGPMQHLAMVELPPCLHAGSGKWAAFINPGLGASFADDAGLDMAPPLAGQVALLAGLRSISEAQLVHALDMLRAGQPLITEAVQAVELAPATPPQGLLLKDATLEDIISHLHANNIEPTFRHLIRGK